MHGISYVPEPRIEPDAVNVVVPQESFQLFYCHFVLQGVSQFSFKAGSFDFLLDGLGVGGFFGFLDEFFDEISYGEFGI